MGGVLSTNNDTLILNLLTPKNDLVIPETSFIRFSVSGTPITVTGLSGGTDGKRIVIANVGVDDISLTHNDTGSTSANRLLNGSLGATKTLSTNDTIEYIYDSVSQKWRYIGGSI